MYNYNSYYRYSSGMEGMNVAIVVIALIVAFLCFVAWCRIFRKADIPWERMFVPIYGSYWTYRIAECGGMFWASMGVGIVYRLLIYVVSFSALQVISVVYLIALLAIDIMYSIRLAKAFGKGGGFAAGLVLLKPLFIMILGFGKAEYELSSFRGGIAVTDTWKCSCGTINPVFKNSCQQCGAQRGSR